MRSVHCVRVRIVLWALVVSSSLLGNGGTSVSQAAITVGPGTDCDFSTIQAGIDAAQDGDLVLVAAGEYVIATPITFRGKAITVRSESGADETTIRMGMPSDPKRASVMIFENNETSASVLEGFTLTGGRGCWLIDPSMPAASGLGGGGIVMVGSSPTIVACSITKNTADSGGGVNPADGSAPTMIDCVISENSVSGSGGGISCWDNSSLTMTDCLIERNSAPGTTWYVNGNGGGIFCGQRSELKMTNCAISDNSAGINGGGLSCQFNSVVTMTNCSITHNRSGQWSAGIGSGHCVITLTHCIIADNSANAYCGGIETGFHDSSLTIRNCTIVANRAGQQGGGIICWAGASCTITNSILWDNMAPSGREVYVQESPSVLHVAYSNVSGGSTGIYVAGGTTLDWGEGNITGDPEFVISKGYWDSNGTRSDTSDDRWIEPDYHLKSQAGRWDSNGRTWIQDDVTSPCIDAGDFMIPIGLEPFPNGGCVNMGVYGGTAEASKTYFGGPVCETIVAGDINGDGEVDHADLEIMALHWTDDEPLVP